MKDNPFNYDYPGPEQQVGLHLRIYTPNPLSLTTRGKEGGGAVGPGEGPGLAGCRSELLSSALDGIKPLPRSLSTGSPPRRRAAWGGVGLLVGRPTSLDNVSRDREPNCFGFPIRPCFKLFCLSRYLRNEQRCDVRDQNFAPRGLHNRGYTRKIFCFNLFFLCNQF